MPLETAIEWLREARRAGPARAIEARRYGYRKRSVQDAKLRHVLGSLLRRRGRTQAALHLLEGAAADFTDLGRPLDVVDVALELGPLYAELRRESDLEHLGQEALRLLAPFPQLQPLRDALIPWQEALLAGASPTLPTPYRMLLTRLAAAYPAGGELLDEKAHKRQLTRCVRQALAGCRSLEELSQRLQVHGVTVHHRPSLSGRPSGIAFELHGRRLTGHQLGREFRLSQILAQFRP